MNRILTGEYHDAVRELLGVSPQTLPNTAIDRENIIVLAELAIIKRVPNYADILTEDGDNAVYLRSATIAQVAANCCPGLAAKFKVSEKSETGYQYGKEAVDWSQKKLDCETQAKECICMISTVEISSPALAGLTGV